jgi:hypothetical protein
MTTLTITKCATHTPHLEAVSTIVHDSEYVTKHTFCESCEQNIECFSFYDDDRGIVWAKWSAVTK